MNRRFFREHRSWLIAFGVTVVIAVWLLSGTLAPPKDEPPRVTQATAARDDDAVARDSVRVRTQAAEEIERTIVVNGFTAPARVVNMAAETDGRVAEIGAERGTNVDAGALLVRLDERDRRARLQQAEATVAQREAEYEARAKLKSSSYVSATQLKEALAALEAARAELLRARLDLEYMSIRAPFDGALQARSVEIGDYVKSGDPVATFVDNRSIVVSADLSEYDAGHIAVGDPGDAELATGESLQGRVRYVAPVADAATRTYRVELEVDNPDGSLRAGGTAVLKLPAETVLAHRIAPSLLTLDDDGAVGVKIVTGDSKVSFVETDIAVAETDGLWVTGLPVTATIITVGQGFVPDGAFVDAVPESRDDAAYASQSVAD